MGYTRCPRCGSESIEEIVYRLSSWTIELRSLSALRRGELPEWPPIDETSPNYACKDCGHAWPDESRIATAHEIRRFFETVRQSDIAI